MADYQENKNFVCVGTGLLALDVILNGRPETPPKFQAGGSCGNVLTILSYLGWNSFPIARLVNNSAFNELINDLRIWDVNIDLIENQGKGSTPIIIHRIFKDKDGKSKHKFEFKDPYTGAWLPQYKPVIAKDVEKITKNQPKANVFYFDRLNRASIELARFNKDNGALIIFEPSSIKDVRLFKQALEVTHILKFSKDRIDNYQEIFKHQQAILEIETLGNKGLQYRYSKFNSSQDWKKLEPYKIDDSLIKDTAGAGDWCTSGIIDYLGKRGIDSFDKMTVSEIETALQLGQAMGAINCCFDGARGLMYKVYKDNLIKTIINLQENGSIWSLLNESKSDVAPKQMISHSISSIASLYKTI